ncbi:zinc metalloprotease [Crateriforma spongiae]|uniref:hypothetical protein n=1 Tax=Crateriforma spongiae TaxID=2724528 RepID=UPI00197E324B|nr:hypothetical protein [Crateriforma spongiae]
MKIADPTTGVSPRHRMLSRCCVLAGLIFFAMAVPAWAQHPAAKTTAVRPTVRVILFVPSDRRPPDDSLVGLNKVADLTDRLILGGIRKWGFRTGEPSLFQRVNGMVRPIIVAGKMPAKHYTKPSVHKEAIRSALQQNGVIAQPHDVWWVFVYVGEPPERYSDFRGGFSEEFGGWSVANYDSRMSRINIDAPLASGLNDTIALKGTIHELGHGFGLPHIGPKSRLKRGNTLMGPINAIYRRISGDQSGKAYISQASAAMLAIHPIIRGKTPSDTRLIPTKVSNARLISSPGATAGFQLSGRVAAETRPLVAVVGDHHEKRPGEYWTKHYIGPVGRDGRFQVHVNEAVPVDGEIKLWFLFDNGTMTADGQLRGARGAITLPYRFTAQQWQLTSP